MSVLQKRIFGSVLLGVLIVGSAFWLSRTNSESESTASVAAVTTLSERKHIAVTDSNQDGVPDWQAKLVPGEPIYINATTSSTTVEIPDNVSGRFSQRFFSDVLVLDSLGQLEASQDQLVRDSIAQLEDETQAPQYTRDDLNNIVTATSPEALRAYGNLVAGNILHFQTKDEHEYEIYQRLVRDENPKHLEKLAVIEQQYTSMIDALLALEVPEHYVFEHLTIINNLSEMRENVIGMQLLFEDPFYTLMRYRRVSSDVLGMSDSIINLHDTLYLDEGVVFEEDDVLPVLAGLLR